MPSGYTAGVQDGTITTFPQFAMTCARAFGALIMMRDDPLSKEIPEEFQPDEHYLKAVDDAKLEIAKFEAMSDESIRLEIERERNEAIENRKSANDRDSKIRERYEAMLALVMAWKPPTPEHAGLHTFMAEQLRESIKWDCKDDSFLERCYPLPITNPRAYRHQKLMKLREQLTWREKQLSEEIERTSKRSEWVRQLRESLKV